jgi:hypothetical protein
MFLVVLNIIGVSYTGLQIRTRIGEVPKVILNTLVSIRSFRFLVM